MSAKSDCWYDVPYVWLEASLRVLTLMAILFLLIIVIHLTVGQLSTLKSFTTFLEHAHQMTDASQLGIADKSVKMKEQGLYSPQDEKEDSDRPSAMQTAGQARNLSKPIPLEIYKGTDDENAYFITFREVCDDKQLADGDKQADSVTPPVKPSFSKSSLKEVALIDEFYSMNDHPQVYVDEHGNVKVVDGVQQRSDKNSASFDHNDNSIDRPKTDQKPDLVTQDKPNLNDMIGLSSLVLESSKRSNLVPDNSKIQQNDLTKFDNYVRIRDGSYVEPGKSKQDLLQLTNHPTAQRSENAESKPTAQQTMTQSETGSDKSQNDPSFHSKPIPKLKLVMDEHPGSVEMKIDLNSVKSNDIVSINGRNANHNKGVDHEGMSIDEEPMDDINDNDAKNFLKDKITREIARKEEEIIERLENRPQLPPMEVASDDDGLGNISLAALGRRPRAIEAIDKTITYSEHERTMKQEVEVTYKRAQDIARAILKTSEAIANSLDLCRKPISTNFISDEPLTEAEDIIDQIVGQLKESLELTMGCRTCVKPHKDLMLFLRWLIFDDVSVKLCPSKPKAADLRKNYLLFNHDNMFVGRVCAPGEYPKAPMNCTAGGEAKPVEEGPPPPGVGGSSGKAVGKKRHRIGHA